MKETISKIDIETPFRQEKTFGCFVAPLAVLNYSNDVSNLFQVLVRFANWFEFSKRLTYFTITKEKFEMHMHRSATFASLTWTHIISESLSQGKSKVNSANKICIKIIVLLVQRYIYLPVSSPSLVRNCSNCNFPAW